MERGGVVWTKPQRPTCQRPPCCWLKSELGPPFHWGALGLFFGPQNWTSSFSQGNPTFKLGPFLGPFDDRQGENQVSPAISALLNWG